MIKLKNLLLEILKENRENAALEYLIELVKTGPFTGRVFLAGGAVRDMELGKQPKDLDVVVTGGDSAGIDFATWATKKMNNYREGSNPVIFPRFFTAKFTLDGVVHNGIDLTGFDIEAVATRKEKYTDGNRKPEVSSGTLEDDVARRDFTVNSLLKDLTSGEILDLTGMGKQDIKNGIIRTPLNPDIIFSEDPLRMLRAIRFATKYSWDLPFFMIKALKRNAHKISEISEERIQEELNKILVTDYPDKGIRLLKITGLMHEILPEFDATIKMTQNAHHKHDVFQHSLEVLKNTKPQLVTRLMGLFHDIGKVATRSISPTGIHFYGHEDAGVEIAEKIMKRLRYPNELINAVAVGIKNHMRLKQGRDDASGLSDKALRKFKLEVGEQLDNVLNLIHADNISHAEESSLPNQINIIKQRLEKLDNELKNSGNGKLPLSGNDLLELGLRPGPEIGRILNIIKDRWLENPSISKEEALEIARKEIKK
jgi:poly(A) polymerase